MEENILFCNILLINTNTIGLGLSGKFLDVYVHKSKHKRGKLCI